MKNRDYFSSRMVSFSKSFILTSPLLVKRIVSGFRSLWIIY